MSRRTNVRGDRIRLITALSDGLPMSLKRAADIFVSAANPLAAVLSLACENRIEIDLASGPLGPRTKVKLRSPRMQTVAPLLGGSAGPTVGASS